MVQLEGKIRHTKQLLPSAEACASVGLYLALRVIRYMPSELGRLRQEPFGEGLSGISMQGRLKTSLGLGMGPISPL